MTNNVLTGHRQTDYSYTLLNKALAPVGALSGVRPGGTLEWSASKSVKGSGSLTVVGQDVDWWQSRIKVTATVTNALPSAVEPPSVSWDLGVWVPSRPGDDWTPTGKVQTLGLLDLTSILDRTGPVLAYSAPAGAVVTTKVRAIITSIGLPVAITDSALTLRSGLVWDTNASWLTICNDMLDAIGYQSLRADRSGIIRAQPYIAPSLRPYAWEFVSGSNCIFTPTWNMRQNIDSVPTRVVLSTTSSPGIPPLYGIYDAPAGSKWSAAVRGYEQRYSETVEAPDQATIDAMARSRWVSLSTPQVTREIRHAPVPLDPSDAARFSSTRAGVDARHVVSRTVYHLEDTALQDTTLLEVAS